MMTPARQMAIALAATMHFARLAQGQELEVRFWPADRVYLFTVAEPWLHDFVLQNVAVINRSRGPVTLIQLEIGVLRQGRVVQQRVIPLSQLAPNLRSFLAKYAGGDLKVWESEYQLTALFSDAKLVGDAHLPSNEGISVRDLYLAFNDDGDTVQVVATGTAEDGSQSRGVARLPLESYQSQTTLRLPLSRTWQVANGPYPQVSHRWVIHQEFGYDFWKIDGNGSDHRGDGTGYEEYYSYGQEVLAPADATVIELRNDAEDSPLINDQIITDQSEFLRRLLAQRDLLFQRGGYTALGGNYLILDHGNGEFSHLAHLKKGSVLVKVGDRVRQGQPLALVGNSGLSNVPHLHYELVAAPDLPHRRGLPLRLTWINAEAGARTLGFGEFVRHEPPKP